VWWLRAEQLGTLTLGSAAVGSTKSGRTTMSLHLQIPGRLLSDVVIDERRYNSRCLPADDGDDKAGRRLGSETVRRVRRAIRGHSLIHQHI